jgi:5-methylthioribose kinase
LVRKKKTLTEREETIKEARRVFHTGIREAWDIYTKDNKIVQEAKKTLSSAIDETYKSCLPENGEGLTQREYEQANRIYVETLSKLYCNFADRAPR